jgi:hypothetical protein
MTGSDDPLDPAAERRWALRRGIDLDADLSDTAGMSCVAKVTDISEEGCMIRFFADRDLARDLLHTIKVTGLEALSGYVIWSAEGKAGLAFATPLHPATVQSLVMKSHYARISRDMAAGATPDRLPSLPPFPFDE